jgi:hypothetical protein
LILQLQELEQEFPVVGKPYESHNPESVSPIVRGNRVGIALLHTAIEQLGAKGAPGKGLL